LEIREHTLDVLDIAVEGCRNEKEAKVTINFDPEVVRKARELGLNISKIAENALKEYLNG